SSSKTLTLGTSTNGVDWTFRDSILPTTNSAQFGGGGIGAGIFVAAGGTPPEVWVSRDEGINWSRVNGPWESNGVTGVAFAANGGSIVAATSDKIYSASLGSAGTVPQFTSTNAFSGTVGVVFSNTVTASGSTPITFSASNLPAGLTNSTNGLVTGIPTTAGTKHVCGLSGQSDKFLWIHRQHPVLGRSARGHERLGSFDGCGGGNRWERRDERWSRGSRRTG
ncbi:MAG: hypothetical protein EBZ78_12660, partial [Verrucomicrobia bacterium]|nr:hypothetical protein [Verrucomicrobiota bacterium]